MALLDLLTSARGLEFDKYMVRYSGHSLLNHVFAWQAGIDVQSALLLRTQGARTGAWREAVLPFFRHGEELVIVGSNGGAAADPQWVNNLRHQPQAEVFIERRLRLVTARLAEGDEYTRWWKQVTDSVPTYADYQRRCEGTRQIPLVVLNHA